MVALGRLRTGATRGFLGFTAFCAAAFGALAWLSDTALPTAVLDSPVVVDPVWQTPRQVAMALFVGWLGSPTSSPSGAAARAVPIAAAGLALGVAILGLGALSWAEAARTASRSSFSRGSWPRRRAACSPR